MSFVVLLINTEILNDLIISSFEMSSVTVRPVIGGGWDEVVSFLFLIRGKEARWGQSAI